MSDDRFARQNRFGPPPEFPLASTCTSIGHHLSGRSMYALAPHLFRRKIMRADDAPFHRSFQDLILVYAT